MRAKILLFSVLLFSTFIGVQAQQTLKIGHVNVQDIVRKHPAMDSIKTILENESKDMEGIYAEMLAEHEKKMASFEAESASYSDFVKETRQKEIMELAQKIQTFNTGAQQQLKEHNMELIQPIYNAINQEISNIAGYQKFSYILDVSTGAVAYISPESEDITALVLEKVQKK